MEAEDSTKMTKAKKRQIESEADTDIAGNLLWVITPKTAEDKKTVVIKYIDTLGFDLLDESPSWTDSTSGCGTFDHAKSVIPIYGLCPKLWTIPVESFTDRNHIQ